MRLGSVADNYRKLQETAGIEPKGTLVKNVKSRLKNAFGKKVDFFQRSGSLLEIIYGTENVPFKDSTSERSNVDLVKKTAKLLRQELLNSPDVYFSWPPTEREVLSAKYITPPLAEAFLSTLLTSRGLKSSRLTRIISSLAQDLAYNPSFGRKRVQKHVQLGISVKRKSGSVDLIHWLNCFGHTVSYDKISSIEFVPNNIQPSVFVTFAFDNCDHNIESIYNVTRHGTNGIIIQKCLQTNNNDINTNPSVKDVCRRSFKPVCNELQLYIKTKARLNPVAIPIADTGVNQLNGFYQNANIWFGSYSVTNLQLTKSFQAGKVFL